MDKVAKFEEELLSGDIVKPIYDVKIVTSAPLSPESPMVEWLFREISQLVSEISGHDADHTLVSCSHVILLQYLQCHHLRPPVFCLASLEALDVFT